jgi:hypothetical protein
MRKRIQQQILQKRVDAIMKNGSSRTKVSDPVPFVSKKWVSPLAQLHENDTFDPLLDKKIKKPTINQDDRNDLERVVKVLDLNKKLRYFG